ncbi:MAG TPA: hypothetical protein VGB57_13365, partial [Allosphingosinicella sp.]
ILIANLEAMPTPVGARPAAAKPYKWFTNAAPGGTPPLQPVSHAANHRIRCAFDPVTGRLIAAPPVGTAKEVADVRIAYGYGIGREIGAGPQDRNDEDVPFDIIDTADLQHFVRVVDAEASATAPANVVKTLAAALVDWKALGAGKRGLIVLVRCDLDSSGSLAVAVHPASELHIVSAQWRPRTGPRHGYVVRKDRIFTIGGQLKVEPQPVGAKGGALILDGLEITGGVLLGARAVSSLTVRYCTLRAPGAAALDTTIALNDTDIVIHRSIVGRIRLDVGAAVGTGSLAVAGSLVSADGFAGAAITAGTLDTRLADVTVFGPCAFKSLEATNVIFDATAAVAVTRTQVGCVRFSWVPPGSKTPRRFRCQPDLAVQTEAARKGAPLSAAERSATTLSVTPIFLDTALGEPTAAMLHPLTSAAIASGGEGDSEMGVFAASAERLRMSNIESLFDDYVPFGLEAGLIDDTRSSAVAQRRNRP